MVLITIILDEMVFQSTELAKIFKMSIFILILLLLKDIFKGLHFLLHIHNYVQFLTTSRLRPFSYIFVYFKILKLKLSKLKNLIWPTKILKQQSVSCFI